MSTTPELNLSTIIESIRKQIRDNVHTFCFGCQNDKSSQKDHDVCLMMNSKEQFDLMFDVSWHQQDPNQILCWVKDIIRTRMSQEIDETA